ncbi:MAG: polysulfide reductase NrfD, partial [Rhodothermales bacterium]|nr:polysulfide reductase NrfD [Rhodothermales bacterium]
GILGWSSPLWTTAAPILGLVFLLATVGFLIWDLEHPKRFFMVLTRPQWKSWLVRGGFALTAYGAVLAGHLLLMQTGRGATTPALAWIFSNVAVISEIYTAFLFQQSKARDLWQNPLLAPHLLVQAILAGSGVLLIVAPLFGTGETVGEPLAWVFCVSSVLHLFMVLAEAASLTPTAHARLAHHEMIGGRFKAWFWAGVALTAVGAAIPWIGPAAAGAGLIGLFLFEHAYVQAGQSPPLA